jgi:hypothetical protein
LAFDVSRTGGVLAHKLAGSVADNWSQHAIARTQRLSRRLDVADPRVRERVLARAEQSSSLRFMWLLLTLLELHPAAAWEGPFRLRVLKQLAQAEDAILRFAAYRWLAALHTIDLRCEMSAKRELITGAGREQGLARRRVEQLLRRC